MFVWDEDKRRLNLRKHGIDFADAAAIRIISIRKATKHEARFYFSQVTY